MGEKAFEEARRCQQKSAAAFRASDIDGREAAAKVWDARQEERRVDETLMIAATEQLHCEAYLEEFRSGPREALEALIKRQNEVEANEPKANVACPATA